MLWFIDGNTQTSSEATQIIENTQNEIAVSVASLFEIAIKLKIGKLSLVKTLGAFITDVEKAWIEIMPIADQHLIAYQTLPDVPGHRDPFDRLIIAAAIAENATIITLDPKFRNYQQHVQVVW